MATMPCPRCKTELALGAPFCTSCGAKMADFSVDGVPPGMMPICGGCGALTASDRSGCMLCGASYTLKKLVPTFTDGRYFTRIVAHFLCRSCGQRSPLNALDVDGMVTCTRCGLTQAYDVSVWSEALETAHGVSDLAFPKPDGRFANAGDPPVADHAAAAVGKSRSALTFDASSVTMDGAVMRTRSISLEAAPGHPLCETCHAPLFARLESGQLRIGCETCNTVMRYGLPTPVAPVTSWPVAIYADDCCLDRPDANMVQSAGGAVAIKCPTCNAALEANPDQHFVTCNYCRTACRIPSRTLWALHTDKVEAKPFWLMFEGPSRMRQSFVSRSREDAERARRARERAERERLEAERRAEHTRQFEMPPTPSYGRKDHVLRALVGALITLTVGAAGWGGDILHVVQTGQSAGGFFSFGGPTGTSGTSTSSPSAPPVPATPLPSMSHQPVGGCTCAPSATGLAEEVSLGLRIGTTMQIGNMVTTSADWALVGKEGPVTNLTAHGLTAPRNVVESHAYDVVIACASERVHFIDGQNVTTYAARTGAPLATGPAVTPVPQTSTAYTGLYVTCTRGTVDGDAIAWTDSSGAPQRTMLPNP